MMVKKSALPFVVIAVILFLFIGQAGASLLNGDFSSDLAGWSYEDRGPGVGDFDLSSDYVKIVQGIGNEQFSASLTTGGATGPALISLYQWFEIPADALLLEFGVAFSSVGTDNSTNTGFTFPDFFQVSYLDDDLDLAPSEQGGPRTSSYDVNFIDTDAMGSYYPSTLSTHPIQPDYQGWYNFSFNISNLREHTGTLFFDLLDSDVQVVSEVLVHKVAITPVPEPATMLLFVCGVAGLIGLSRRRR